MQQLFENWRKYLKEEIEYALFKGKPSEPGPYYHGTSDKFDLKPGDSLKAPKESGIQTEPRKQRRGKIFFTTKIDAAKTYANRAVRIHGGNPIIYEIDPKVICELDPENSKMGVFADQRATICQDVLNKHKKVPYNIYDTDDIPGEIC